MSKTYEYRDNRSFGVPAQQAGERLAEICHDNWDDLKPALVVADASDPSSPLHPVFDWDDTSAARKHREHHARNLIGGIREVRVEIVDDRPKESKQISFVSVGVSKVGGARYVTMDRAMAEPDLRERVLADAWRGLRAWQSRYGHLEELADVVRAIEAIADVTNLQPA